MKWYPWLNLAYRQIIERYCKSYRHHALLLHSQPGNGIESLFYALSRWMMCQKPNGIKSCNVCQNCQLMVTGNHPDFYKLAPENNQQSLGIEQIRTVINSIYGSTNQEWIKIVWLPNTEALTESATNALLKTLEEPPKNTHFLIGCQKLSNLLPTLRSRCLYWPLLTADEELGLRWLQRSGYNNLISIRTALRLCTNAPLAAEALLQPVRWKERLIFCNILQNIYTSNNFLDLLPALDRDKDNEPLYWLLTLLADALKWKYNAHRFLINIDKKELVIKLAERWPASVLHTQWQQWLKCLHQWQEINGINRELLVTYNLLNWEQATTNACISL